jgi:ComF family protein
MFRYADPVDHMITALKFQGEMGFARVLGMLLAWRIRAADPRLPQALVPMPLHAARYRERGFNQAAAIAAHVGPRLRVPLATGLLARVRATAPQSGLSAVARRQNIQDAFAVMPGCRVPARVALLDDVLTTGSTAAAAAAALRAAGARHVALWICARAARREPGGTAGPIC